MGIRETFLIAGIALAGAAAVNAQEIPAGAEIADVRKVPVEALFRITRADGQVFYVSGNRRWLFHGKLMDMWTGADEKDMDRYDRMSWERSGFTPNEVSLGETGSEALGVLFLSQHCDGCLELLNEIQNKALAVGIATIPPAGQKGMSMTRALWCESGAPLALARKWIQNSHNTNPRNCGQSDAVGKIQAMIEVYGLRGNAPIYITASGRIIRGDQEILEVWSSK